MPETQSRSAAEGMPRSLTLMRVKKMRRINEFKSYRSAVDYDVTTGQFIVTPMPDIFAEDETADHDIQSAEIVPFPEPEPATRKQRLAS
jgi:hypothetical protein